MASQYDFKNLENDIASLEKKLDKFQSSFNNAIQPILNAKFNDREYGSREVEKQVDNIIKNAKREINSTINDFVNDIRRKAHASSEAIKSKANVAVSSAHYYNKQISGVDNLNTLFMEGDYKQILNETANISSFSDTTLKYVTLLRIESFEKLCRSLIKDRDADDFHFFTSYYEECIKNDAKNHIASARELYFVFGCIKMEDESFNNNKDKYDLCVNLFEAYFGLSEEKQETYADYFKSIYRKGTELFNEISNNDFKKFKYKNVKKLLKDSSLFNKEDIALDFFKDSSTDSERMFNYLKEHGSYGELSDRRAAFEDTIRLARSSLKSEFAEYWVVNYDQNGWEFIKSIIESQANIYSGLELICPILKSKFYPIKKLGDLTSSLYSLYYDELRKMPGSVSLDEFTDCSVVINDMLNSMLNSNVKFEEGSDFKSTVRSFDELLLGMITKYRKHCCRYNEHKICLLNKVLDDLSVRLNGKKYRKDLRRDESKPALNTTGIKVRLVTNGSIKKKRKIIIFVGAALGILIIAAVILMICLIR